jgi:serine/threonine protein kinase/tetratricopeptide (TPR) repeat protein
MQFRELTDRYQLEKILKSTRFGTVLRAADAKSGQTVAAKLITVTSPPRLVAGAPEFDKLGATLAGMAGHPSLPAVLDSGFTTDGSAFLVMELLEGKGLDTLAGSPPAQTLERISQALDGLEALAAQGIAHLNISPDNLLVVETPAGEEVKLLGLGTAVFRPRGAEAVAGVENARFQAPEVAAGAVTADSRADLYSLAVTTCHALGATIGFGDSPVVQLPLSVSFDLENDEALRQGLERALRQRPEERPSIRELREALRLAIGAPAVVAVAAAQSVAPPKAPSAAEPPPHLSATGGVSQVPFPAATQVAVPEMTIPDAWSPSTAAQPGAAAAPQFTEPDPLASPESPPEEQGDVLSSVDDELLNALLSVPAPPPRPSGPPAQAQRGAKVVPFLKKPKESPAPAAGGTPTASLFRGMLRKPAVLAVAGVVALGLLAGLWLLWPHKEQTVVTTVPSGPPLLQPPTQPPTARLEEAKLYLAQGEDLKARRVLRSIPWGEQGLLAPAGCRALSAIQENLALAAFERLPADLASGLKSGDLESLETAVEAGAGQEAGLAPAVRADFDRARGAVAAYAQVRAASAQGNPVQALERFAALATLIPKASDPDNLRGKAAAAIEAEAEKLLRDGRYAEALARMEPVQRTWFERPGLRERLALYQKYEQDEALQERILGALPNIERHKKPWDGLQMMTGVTPTPHLATQLQEARARLEDLLARLDKEAPKLVLRDGFMLDYARGTVANLSFRASDDYEVREVKLMARPEGGKYHDLPLEKTRTGYYTVEIPVSFHQNGTVDFYVVASDLSGHETYVGSRDQPMQLKRQQGFQRIIQ